MNFDEIVKKANDAINSWVDGPKKLVVAIDGYTGVGKTTLLNQLAEINPDILPAYKDDFLLSRQFRTKHLSEFDDKSVYFELHNNDYEKIEAFVTRFKLSSESYTIKIFNGETGEIDIDKTFDFSKKILIIEGIFLFHPERLNYLWDKRIFLEGDTTLIDERRVKREKERWGDKYYSETNTDSHFRHTIIAFQRYKEKYKPEKMADLVISV